MANVSASNLALLQQLGPSLSDFCGPNLDDSIEIVLRRNCILRNGSLHNTKGIVIRPLTMAERKKIGWILGEGNWKKRRKEKEEELINGRQRRSRRSVLNILISINSVRRKLLITTSSIYICVPKSKDIIFHCSEFYLYYSIHRSLSSKGDVEDGITGLIGHLFNVNESVARRFLPMAKSDPFLANLNDKLLEAMTENDERGRGKGKNIINRK